MEVGRFEKILYRLIPNAILRRVLPLLEKFKFIRETENGQVPVTFDVWYNHKVLGSYSSVYWPIHPTSTVVGARNIYCGIDTSPGYSPGNYIQGMGKIFIGDYTQIAPNVGIISANHDVYDNRKHEVEEVKIGKYCWLGFGCKIMPGVILGDFTIVAAGAVVTKSFKEGYCVIGGVPAGVIRTLEEDKCVRYENDIPYNGYIKSEYFDDYRKRMLNI